MLVEEGKINQKEFLFQFRKSFANFCQKAPIFLKFTIIGDKVTVFEVTQNISKTFIFDYEIGVKSNIKKIKDYLNENLYPVMVEELITEKDEIPTEEINKISEGKSIDDIVFKKEIINYRIERVITANDFLFVRNMSTKDISKYKMNMPVTLFLKKLREELTPEEGYKLFKDKSKFLKVMIEIN